MLPDEHIDGGLTADSAIFAQKRSTCETFGQAALDVLLGGFEKYQVGDVWCTLCTHAVRGDSSPTLLRLRTSNVFVQFRGNPLQSLLPEGGVSKVGVSIRPSDGSGN